MSLKRIDKAYYRANAPRLWLWWPLRRERRMWRAGWIHLDRYERHMLVRAMLDMMEMNVGETKNGVTLLAKVEG